MFHIKTVIRNFAIFTEKQLLKLEPLFKKVVGLQVCNFIKYRMQDKCFPVNNFKNTYFEERHIGASEKTYTGNSLTHPLFFMIN